MDKNTPKQCLKCYLSSENIKSETIEAAYNRLLNVQTEVIKSLHCRQQQTRPPTTKHMYIHRTSFLLPHFNL